MGGGVFPSPSVRVEPPLNVSSPAVIYGVLPGTPSVGPRMIAAGDEWRSTMKNASRLIFLPAVMKL